MLQKVWNYIKENVVAIITAATALLTFAYAVLRLGIYVYWKGYFQKLNIDINFMNLNFDRYIFGVVFVALIFLLVFFFMAWAYEIALNILGNGKENNKNERNSIVNCIKKYLKALFFTFLTLLFMNVPLFVLMSAISTVETAPLNTVESFLLLYISEILLIFLEISKNKENKKKSKISHRRIAFKLLIAFTFAFFILVQLFNMGAKTVDNMSMVSLLENENYMISYNDGENCVLHKVDYDDGEIVIYRNEQKVIKVANNEIKIKPVKKVEIKD